MFKKRKLICILFLFSCIFICMSFVSADNITNDTSYNNENNTPIVVDSPTKTFSDLKNEIYDMNKTEIILEDDYVNQKVYDNYSDYYPQSDMIIIVERVTTGILINRSVNIDGQGHIIDANNLSEIFYLNANNITLKNIVFKNTHGFNFGAVFCNASNISIINCTFINNHGITGAVYCNNQNISIINSTFINNTGSVMGAAAIRCQVPADIINSTFINNNGDYCGYECCPVIYSCKGGRIINSTFIDNYVYNSDEEKYAGIYYYDIIFNVVNETITYSENSDKVRSIVYGNFIIINSTFNNTLTHEIHYDRWLVIILDGSNNTNTTETITNNSTSNNQSTTENNTNSTNNAGINKTSDVSEHVVPVNFDVDNNMSQITPTITIIANNTYVINGADNIIEIGFKTNIKNKMFWVEILGLLSKTNITSNDFYATIKLTNITKKGNYTILCGFNDYVKPVVVGSDDIIGVTDKKTIQINYNNSTSNNQSTTENNTCPTNNGDVNKTTDDDIKPVIPVNDDVDTNMSQITPTINIIANNTYVINGADNIIEIGFKTNIKNKMFWVEILGLLSKTNITSNDFYATIKLTNITKKGNYTILCGFNDYVKPVVVGSDDIIGVTDKKTIQINYNNSTSNNQSTTENNTHPTNNMDANKTTGNNAEKDINNTSVPSNSDIGNNNKNQVSSQQVKKQNQQITPVVKTSLLLTPVKVEKSAKKLVLQVVLKQGNKLLSGKKVTFKFNGKKYTAKTNKKGIAKVTINKNILKKLKRGKKVKYQVNYGKTVSNKNLIVK